MKGPKPTTGPTQIYCLCIRSLINSSLFPVCPWLCVPRKLVKLQQLREVLVFSSVYKQDRCQVETKSLSLVGARVEGTNRRGDNTDNEFK